MTVSVYTSFVALLVLAVYAAVLMWLSRAKAGEGSNADFFLAARKSPWWLVAFGMIGASVSGVSFVSVPGWVRSTQMTYLQMCLGFVLGYVAVAFVLLPLYYRLRLTSIYAYLGERFGNASRRTGSSFFFLSKMAGASARMYLACLVVHQFVAEPFGIPFAVTAGAILCFIWVYTRRSGIRSIVHTDVLQTLCLLLSVVAVIGVLAWRMQLGLADMVRTVWASPMGQVFCFEPDSTQNFWRQFLSGVFIVVVMTGLDQDMMQKNLTCRSLRDAQKDMCSYGMAFVPVNLLLLAMGVLLYEFCARQGISAPASGDSLLPMLVGGGWLGSFVAVPFTLGVVAAAFSSADSALTALTTTACIDFLKIEERHLPAAQALRLRRRVHLAVTLVFFLCILLFKATAGGSIINTIYVLAGYTYGPLLGLYAFGMLSRRTVRDAWVPVVAIMAPVVCGLLDAWAPSLWGYTFGYELLMLNGLLTMAGLWIISKKSPVATTVGQDFS